MDSLSAGVETLGCNRGRDARVPSVFSAGGDACAPGQSFQQAGRLEKEPS